MGKHVLLPVLRRTCLLLLCWLLLTTQASGWTQPKPTQPPLSKMIQHQCTSRRFILSSGFNLATTGLLSGALATVPPAMAIPTIDVNNAMAREYTAFPGLYPTIATKIVNAAKDEPFTSKKQIYAALNEVEQDRLRQYDKSIIISKPDRALQQFKTSQICKYECGSRTSDAYRDEQIKAVQSLRSQ